LLHIEHARIDLHSALGRAIVLKLQQKAVIVNSLDGCMCTILKEGL
jgi:hypothetical protein